FADLRHPIAVETGADGHGAVGGSSDNRGSGGNNGGPGSDSPFGPSADAAAASGSGFRQLTAAEVEADLIRRIEEGVIDLTLHSDSDSELDGAAVAPQPLSGRGHGARMRSG
ncbi:hypothetical protein VaNZ11_002312, partial [Volvox africanus]